MPGEETGSRRRWPVLRAIAVSTAERVLSRPDDSRSPSEVRNSDETFTARAPSLTSGRGTGRSHRGHKRQLQTGALAN